MGRGWSQCVMWCGSCVDKTPRRWDPTQATEDCLYTTSHRQLATGCAAAAWKPCRAQCSPPVVDPPRLLVGCQGTTSREAAASPDFPEQLVSPRDRHEGVDRQQVVVDRRDLGAVARPDHPGGGDGCKGTAFSMGLVS